jgi:cyclic pyranopterin phosphate synthase
MPEEGIQKVAQDELLSFEEITAVVCVAADHGISKIRLTGGEPLIRRNIVKLVRMISAIPGVKDLSMTTNGILLSHYASELRQAGLDRLNISLDTLDPEKYRVITRCGTLDQVLAGIDAAREQGFSPIKINMVLRSRTEENDIEQLHDFCHQNGYELRFIREMDRERGVIWPVEGGDGGHCQLCNRLRLSSDGYFYPCLFSDRRYSIRDHGILAAMMLALENKPESGQGIGLKRMCSIGG